MIRNARFTDDMAALPTHKFGTSSLTWWGIIGFMVIEGVAFGLVFAVYFFLMGHEQGWPPEGRQAPGLLAGTLFTMLILVSEIPNTRIKNAAQAHDIDTVRTLLPLMCIGKKASWNPKKTIQKPIFPSVSFIIRPVILGNQ